MGDGDDDEHVSVTQYDVEISKDNLEVVGPCKTHTHYATHTHNENFHLNVLDGGHIPRRDNDPLTFPSQVSQPSWMVEAKMNLNKHIFTSTNDESISMPSHPLVMNDDTVHFYVDVGSLEELHEEHGEPTQEDNVFGAPILANIGPLPMNTPTLCRFLKFPMERVSTNARKITSNST